MNGIWFWIPISILALLIGLGIGYYIKQTLVERELQRQKIEADRILR